MALSNKDITVFLSKKVESLDWLDDDKKYGSCVVSGPIDDVSEARRLLEEVTNKLGPECIASIKTSTKGYHRIFIEKDPIKKAILAEKKQQEENSPKSNTLLQVREIDWKTAKKYFTKYPNETKLSRKSKPERLGGRQTALDVSFLNINGVIYAKKTGECCGEGSFGKVKIVENESGDNFAVKVEGRGRRGMDDAETKIMSTLGELQGEAERLYGKKFKGRYPGKKLYTVMNLKKGDELYNHLYTSKHRNSRKSVSEEMKILMAIKSAEAIENLHSKNILHCDIKPENFMANLEGNQLTIASIDFGFSQILASGQTQIRRPGRGSPLFSAPEICNIVGGKAYWKNPAVFSKASDIYALGKMYEYDLGLDLSGTNLLAANPADRPEMPELLDILYEKLAEQKVLSPESKALLDAYNESKKVKQNNVKEYLGLDKGTMTTFNDRPGKNYVVFANEEDLHFSHQAIIREFGSGASRIAGRAKTIEIVSDAALRAIQDNDLTAINKKALEQNNELIFKSDKKEKTTRKRKMTPFAENISEPRNSKRVKKDEPSKKEKKDKTGNKETRKHIKKKLAEGGIPKDNKRSSPKDTK